MIGPSLLPFIIQAVHKTPNIIYMHNFDGIFILRTCYDIQCPDIFSMMFPSRRGWKCLFVTSEKN